LRRSVTKCHNESRDNRRENRKINDTELEVVRSGVLQASAQGIVNAANTAMRGVVDGAIHAARRRLRSS